MGKILGTFCSLLLAGCATVPPAWRTLEGVGLSAASIDAQVADLMAKAEVTGLALALIRDGDVVYRKAYGFADVAAGKPMATDSVLYGASLTKAAFAYMVMQLVDEGVIELDAPITALLQKPLPEYPAFADLAADPRWQQFTPRMLLSHSSGMLNWRWINADKKLDIKYPPGSRYAYSGEGIQLLQLIVEERTGKPLADLMQARVFDRFAMTRTSMVWRADFEGHSTNRYDAEGKPVGHSRRSRARAAGSMDTTLHDFARFMAGVLRGEGLSAAARREMLKPQITIVSPAQFPSHFPGETRANDAVKLAYGLGWAVFESPLGPAFFKEGSDEGTNNFALGFDKGRSGVVMLANSSRADRMFCPLVETLLGKTCLPWFWMGYIPYDRPELRGADARAHPVPPC